MDVQVVSVRGPLAEPEAGLDLAVEVTTGWWRWKRVRLFAVQVRWRSYNNRPRWDGRWAISRLQSLSVRQENEFRVKLLRSLRTYEPTRDPALDDEDTVPHYRVRKRHSEWRA